MSCAVPQKDGADLMYQKISKLLIVMTVSLGLLACAIAGSKLEQQLMSDGAVRLNPAQVTDHLSGNTQVWTRGGSGAYFLPDGTVYVKFDGKTYPLSRGKSYAGSSGRISRNTD